MGKKYGKIILPAVAAIAAGVGAVHTYGDYNRTDNTLMLLNAEGLSAMADPGEPGDGNSDKDDPMITIYIPTGKFCYIPDEDGMTPSYYNAKKCETTNPCTEYSIPFKEPVGGSCKLYKKIEIHESEKHRYQNCETSSGWVVNCKAATNKYAIASSSKPSPATQHSNWFCMYHDRDLPSPINATAVYPN